jgi:hypothetical protein
MACYGDNFTFTLLQTWLLEATADNILDVYATYTLQFISSIAASTETETEGQ